MPSQCQCSANAQCSASQCQCPASQCPANAQCPASQCPANSQCPASQCFPASQWPANTNAKTSESHSYCSSFEVIPLIISLGDIFLVGEGGGGTNATFKPMGSLYNQIPHLHLALICFMDTVKEEWEEGGPTFVVVRAGLYSSQTS